jgi:hypothetical protein
MFPIFFYRTFGLFNLKNKMVSFKSFEILKKFLIFFFVRKLMFFLFSFFLLCNFGESEMVSFEVLKFFKIFFLIFFCKKMSRECL